MQFNDTTNKSGIIQRCEFILGLPDGAISGDTTQLAYFTTLINETYYDVVGHILNSQDTWDFEDSNHTDYQIATRALVAAQRDYQFPDDFSILKIKRVDVTYDGTTWYQANPTDSGEFNFGMGNAAHEDEYFTATQPAYDVKGDYIWVYPLATADEVAAGAKMRIEFVYDVAPFTTSDTTKEPGFLTRWHENVPLGASMKYAAYRNHENAKSLKVLYDERIGLMRQFYSQKQLDKSPVLASGQSIGDYS